MTGSNPQQTYEGNNEIITLSADFEGAVSLKNNGLTLTMDGAGHLIVIKDKEEICIVNIVSGNIIKIGKTKITAKQDGTVLILPSSVAEQDNNIHRVTQAAFDPRNLKPGDFAPDGTIYLGYRDKQDWYVTAEDAKNEAGNRLWFDFYEAMDYADNLILHGHNDWEIPDIVILDEMYHLNHTGEFNETYDETGKFYWTSSENTSSDAWLQRFNGGSQNIRQLQEQQSPRAVRQESTASAGGVNSLII